MYLTLLKWKYDVQVQTAGEYETHSEDTPTQIHYHHPWREFVMAIMPPQSP